MKIGDQQGSMLSDEYKRFMLDSINVSETIRREFSVENNIKFILNINQSYDYFKKEFNLSKDQTRRTKKKIYDKYENIVPNGFKIIKEFPDYLVNKKGLIVFKRHRNVLKQANNVKGYKSVCLTNKQTKTVHRLVAKAFIPNPENKPQINHIDGDKENNNVENLEWCTQIENAYHKKINGLGKTWKAKIAATGQNNSQAKLKPKDVLEIRASTDSSKHLSEVYNVSQHTINDIKARRSWKHI